MLLEEQKRSSEKTTGDATKNDQGQYTKMCGLIKMIFEKISTILFDQETISKLLKFIFDKVSNGKQRQNSSFDDYSLIS